MSYKVGTVIIDVKADTAKLVNGMDRAERSVKKSINNIKKAIISMATAYAGIKGVKAFKSMIDDSIDAADATGKLAQKLGISVTALSKYQYAAKFSAVSTGELNAGLSAMVRRLNNFERDGGGAAKKAMRELGISAGYAREHFTSTDIAFKEILKRLEKMPDGFRKTAIAQDIFSKSASSILRITASDLKKFGDEAQRIGLVVSQSTYQMAADYHDTMDRIGARVKGMERSISFGLIKPMDAASRAGLKMIDDIFGTSAKDKMKNYESIAVTAIGNVVYSFGFIKDAVSGIESVLDTAKLGFLYFVKGIVSAFNEANQIGNKAISLYNSLPSSIRGEKIDLIPLRDIDVVNKKIEKTKQTIKDLSKGMSTGRITAGEFMKNFKSSMIEIGNETTKTNKKVKSSTEIIKENLQKTTKAIVGFYEETRSYANPLADIKQIEENLKKQSSEYLTYYKTIGDYAKAWAIKEKQIRENYKHLLPKELEGLVSIYKKEFFDKFKKETKKTTTVWDDFVSSLYESANNSFFDKINQSLDSLYSKFGMFSNVAKTAFNPLIKGTSNYLTNSVASLFSTQKSTMAKQLKDLGLSLGKDGTWSGNVKGTAVKVGADGKVLQGKSALPSNVLGTISGVKTAFSAIANPSAMLLAPSAYMGQIAGQLYGAGYTGASSFVAGGANVLGGGSALTGSLASTAGGLATAGLAGFGIGSIGDMILGADTHAGVGGALGAAIGSAIPGVGTLLGGLVGSLLGGLFGKTKVTGQQKGIDIFGDATANSVSGQDFLKTFYKKKSWFHTKKWSKEQDEAFTESEKRGIESVISSYDYLLQEMDIVKKLTVKGGRFDSIDDFLSGGVTKAFIDATGNDSKIYQVWVDYAKSIDKKVYEAFYSQISQFITDKRKFAEYSLVNSGDTAGALKYRADYLNKDLKILEENLGVIGITVSEFADRFDKAFKQNLTPQTLKEWEDLGNALESATNAAKALKDATLAQFNDESKYKEYMLSLNAKLQESETNFKLSLINTFKSLKDNVRNFLDSWHSTGYSADVSYEFYARRYNELKSKLNSEVAIGDNVNAQNTLTSLEAVANSLKTSAIATKNNGLLDSVLNGVSNDMQGFYNIFDTSEQAMKVIIAGDTTGITKDATTSDLTDAINKYTSAINTQFGVDDGLDLSDFYTDKSMMTPTDIKAFANILKPKTVEELDKWVNILGNIKWEGADYLKNLDIKDITKTLGLLKELGVENSDIMGRDVFTFLYDSKKIDKKTLLQNKSVLTDSDLEKYFSFSELGITPADISKVLKVLPNNTGGNRLVATDKDFKMTSFDTESSTAWHWDWLLKKYNTVDKFEEYVKKEIEYYSDYYKEHPIPVDDYVDLKKYADGGIVTSPTVGLIGEAGYPEAVIPMRNGSDIPVRIDQSAVVEELRELRRVTEFQSEKITRMERVLSRNEGESGIIMEVAS